MKRIIMTFILAATGSAFAFSSETSPYAGEELNEIKSLSQGEINDLLEGKGMGFAKAAELNQYPGPRHVLDLAEQLQLSNKQIAQTNRSFERMREQAVVLGSQLVEYERELDTLFSSEQITVSNLDSLLLQIGETRARLRGVHLQAHLEMKHILSRHQVAEYNNLRGYSSAGGRHEHTH